MRIGNNISKRRVSCRWGIAALAVALMLLTTQIVWSQGEQNLQDQESKGQDLDSVLAVVNNQVVLTSDLELDMRIFHLLPIGRPGDNTPAKALERLTTRALIEQQIVQEDPHGLEVDPKELQDSLTELKQNLPGCKRADCSTDAGWRAYLLTLGLTPARVSEYWQNRMAVLRFIELRFRSGIRVLPEEIQTYYNDVLVPKYPSPQDAPKLDRITQRIQEILLQQKVNVLLNDWLKSLQDQGQVEILDPLLRAQVGSAPGGEGPGLPGANQKSPDSNGAPVPSIPPPATSAPASGVPPQIGGQLEQ
jgi:peptidyl-prolyl cis-trans isomerase SurA